MVNIIQVAQELGYLNVPDKTLIEIDQLKNYPPEKTVLITTGSQGESMAALSRMAADVHKKVTIIPGCPCIRSCLSGRIETDLFSGKTEICNSGPWRVQTSESKCRNRQDAWYSERKYLYSEIG